MPSSVEDDITKQLHLCVALMSDPLVMLNYPGTVADHFITAQGKIEQLQNFLAIPNDPCASKKWIGSSILNSGVKPMVNLMLIKLMEPLRWKHPKHWLKHAASAASVEGQRNAAPTVFAQEFSGEAHRPCRETEIAREIKESNCMAALVLLYYYLHWHLLLILLNDNLHPCINGTPAYGRLDVDRLLKHLPAFFDTFELRPIRGLLNRDYSASDRGDSQSDCSSSDGDGSDDESDEDGDDGGEELPDKEVPVDKNAAALIYERRRRAAISKRMLATGIHGRIMGIVSRVKQSGALTGFMLSLPAVIHRGDDAGGGGAQGRGQPVRHTKRHSRLINLYRVVLASVSAPHTSDDIRTLSVAHAVTYNGQESEVGTGYDELMVNDKVKEAYMHHLSYRIIQARDESTIASLNLCSNTLSVFNLQDNVQRWYDMCKPFEVQSLSKKDDSDNIDCTRKRFTCVLSELLKLAPYDLLEDAAKKNQLKMACIHDFNSASLMMDICGSFLKLHEVISVLRGGRPDDGAVKQKLMHFFMQTYSSDRALRKVLSSHINDASPESVSFHLNSGAISIPIGNFKKPTVASDESAAHKHEMNLFDMAGHYWGARQADLSTVNHTYFAWPYVESGGSYQKVTKLVRNMIHSDANVDTIALRFNLVLSAGHRNSLYISSMVPSVLKLIEALECTPLLDGNALKIREKNIIHSTKKSVCDVSRDSATAFLRGDNVLFGALNNAHSPCVYNSMSIKTIIAELRSEENALSVRIGKARRGEFKLYTPLSWPIVLDDDSDAHNYAAFQLAGEIVLPPRSRQEYYLSRLAAVADMGANAVMKKMAEGNADALAAGTGEEI